MDRLPTEKPLLKSEAVTTSPAPEVLQMNELCKTHSSLAGASDTPFLQGYQPDSF